MPHSIASFWLSWGHSVSFVWLSWGDLTPVCVRTPCAFVFHRDRGHPFALKQSPQTHTFTPHAPSLSIGIADAPLLSDNPPNTHVHTPCTESDCGPPLLSDFPPELAHCELPIHHKSYPHIHRGPLPLEVAAQAHRAAPSCRPVLEVAARSIIVKCRPQRTRCALFRIRLPPFPNHVGIVNTGGYIICAQCGEPMASRTQSSCSACGTCLRMPWCSTSICRLPIKGTLFVSSKKTKLILF